MPVMKRRRRAETGTGRHGILPLRGCGGIDPSVFKRNPCWYGEMYVFFAIGAVRAAMTTASLVVEAAASTRRIAWSAAGKACPSASDAFARQERNGMRAVRRRKEVTSRRAAAAVVSYVSGPGGEGRRLGSRPMASATSRFISSNFSALASLTNARSASRNTCRCNAFAPAVFASVNAWTMSSAVIFRFGPLSRFSISLSAHRNSSADEWPFADGKFCSQEEMHDGCSVVIGGLVQAAGRRSLS